MTPDAGAPRVYWLTEEFPPETGGTGMVAARIATAVARQGIAICIVTRQTPTLRTRDDHWGSLRVQRIRPAGVWKGKGWRAAPVLFVFLMRLLALLIAQRRSYDLVVVSGIKVMPLIAIPVCRVLGKACIVRLESPFELVEPIAAESLDRMGRALSRPLSYLLGAAQRAALKRADRIVAISQDLEKRLRDSACSSEHILRIPNPIDLERFRPAEPHERDRLRQRLALPLDRTLVLYVGRLSRAKGLTLLIEAWPEVLARAPGVMLVLVGSGKGSWDDCEAALRAGVQAAGLTPHVRFAGACDHVEDYLQAADLYVLPSEYEGFSLSIGEALGCGVPAAVTSVGAAPELIEHGVNGWLFPPKDRAALVDTLTEALGQSERWPEMRRRARATAERYGMTRVAAEYAALCRALTLGTPGGVEPLLPP